MTPGDPHSDPDPRDPYNVSRASRIYKLPNMMTAGNLFCGFAATLKILEGALIQAAATVPMSDAVEDPHEIDAVIRPLLEAAHPGSTMEG